MIGLRTRLSATAAALVLLIAAGPAQAAGYPDTPHGALADCGAGNFPLKGHYTIKVLEKALSELSTDDVEYSTCSDALQAAIRALEHPSRSGRGALHGGGGPGATPPKGGHGHRSRSVARTTRTTTPINISAAATEGRKPKRIHGVDYTPGAITARGSAFLASIPTPVLAVLAALVAALAGLGGLAIRNIVRARRTG